MLHARRAIIYILLPGTNNNIHSSTSYYYSTNGENFQHCESVIIP